MIALQNISCGYGKKAVLNKVSFTIEPAELTCFLGENGAGKTTLFKTVMGLLPVMSGKILYDGKEHMSLSEHDYARKISYVPQANNMPFAFNVFDVVLMGQYVHTSGFLRRPSAENRAVAERSIEMLGIEKLRKRNFSELSGGERQLVLIARAVAQKPEYIAMDEPTANLDLGNRVKVMEVASKLVGEGYGIVMNTHSPQHALRYADRVVMLQNGTVAVNGRPEEVLNSESVSSLYGTPLEITEIENRKGKKQKVLIHI